MKIEIPDFKEGVNYIELSPKDGKNKYRYVTTRPLRVYWNGYIPRGTQISFRDKRGREWLYMDNYHFIIHNHYAWDGCTPKKHIPIFGWVGSPDFKKTMLASLIHDAFCQFQDTEHFPFKRDVIDEEFKKILKHEKFILTPIYYAGVRFGAKVFSTKNNDVYSIITFK